MSELDKKYTELLRDILENGIDDDDRTGTGTRKVTGRQVRFEVDANNFPIVTKKKIVWNSLWTELVWFIQGRTNTDFLHEHGVHIWDQWQDENGELGPGVYGKMWRDWNGTDQLQQVVNGLRENPASRRHLVSAWNVDEIPNTNLPPCHVMYQFISKPRTECDGRKLDIVVTQRSSDTFIGACFNWSSYATLLILISKITDHEPGEVIWNGGDVHLYQNHFGQARKVLNLKETYDPPKLEVGNIESLEDITHSSAKLKGYEHGPFIKATVAA